MVIKRVIIENYKSFKGTFELDILKDMSIIVGDNEVGKTSLLECINLALTNQINGRACIYELTPFMFNAEVVKEYLNKIKKGEPTELPKINIELYFNNSTDIMPLKGINNSKREDCPGVKLSIEFNEAYIEEYEQYISEPEKVTTIPIEYYEVKWYSFANNSITSRSMPINVTYIDASSNKLANGADKYISKIINNVLDDREKAQLALNYRKLKESFVSEESVKGVNTKLNTLTKEISEKEIIVSVDVSNKSNWETALTSYLDEVPFSYAGQGEQNSIKMKLALETNGQDCNIILIEEPENHLSFTNMSKLINGIGDKCSGKQLVITTHSPYVANKLGLENLILFGENKEKMSLSNLSAETQDYFKKLPGYYTLRMVLSKKPILCEGPSDELIIQKAYLKKYKKLPIEDGVDVITVKGLSFKRFLEIAKLIGKPIAVVTDNDGSVSSVRKKYSDYIGNSNINICFDCDENYRTLEPQICKVNKKEDLERVLNISMDTIEEVQNYMIKHKTEVALKIFESDEEIIIPEYIYNAIK